VISCFHNERERSVGKTGESAGISSEFMDSWGGSIVLGNMASRWSFVVSRRSGKDESASKSIKGNDAGGICGSMGCCCVVFCESS